MPELPTPDDLHSLAIRTHFGDDAAWEAVRQALTASWDGFQANLQFVDDRQHDNLTVEKLLALADGSDQTFVFLVDREAMVRPEHPVLVVNLFGDRRGSTFRVAPSAIWAVQNNLVIGNMDWEDFSESLDADGVFRRTYG